MMFSGKFAISTCCLLVAIALQASGILTPGEAWAGLANSSVVLMAAMFVVGEGLSHTSVLKKLSRNIIKPDSSDRIVMVGFFVITFMLALFCTTVTNLAIVLPIIYAICAGSDRSVSKFIQPVFITATVWTSVIPMGGNASTYLQLNAMIEEMGGIGTFDYFTITIAKAPVAIAVTLYTIFVMPKLMHVNEENNVLDAAVEKKGTVKDSDLDPLHEKLAYGIFIFTIVGIVYCALTKGNVSSPACIGAILMVLLRVLSVKQARTAIQLPTIFIFVGMLPLSTALAKTGGDVFIANAIKAVLGGTTNSYIIMGLFFIVTAFITQFMSNTAVVTIFRPIAISVAVQSGWDPIAILIAVTIGSNCAFCSPMASPGSTLAFDTGKYDIKAYAKQGAPALFIAFVAFMVFVPLIYPVMP